VHGQSIGDGVRCRLTSGVSSFGNWKAGIKGMEDAGMPMGPTEGRTVAPLLSEFLPETQRRASLVALARGY